MGFPAIVSLSGRCAIAICNNTIADCDKWQAKSAKDLHNPEITPMVSTGTGIAGGIGTSMDGGRGQATFYVEVSNVAETLTIVEGRGGRTLTGPEQVPNGPLIALFADPEGHLVGLVQAGRVPQVSPLRPGNPPLAIRSCRGTTS
jgi:predicted enzyme related to lactoylglutathione lyase